MLCSLTSYISKRFGVHNFQSNAETAPILYSKHARSEIVQRQRTLENIVHDRQRQQQPTSHKSCRHHPWRGIHPVVTRSRLTARSVHYCALDIILYYLLIIVKITYIIQDQLWLAYGVLSAQMCSERCSAGAKFYTRLQHACAVGTSRAISSTHRRVTSCVWRHLAQNLSVSRSLKIQAAGGESGAKLHSTSHVRHIETSLMLKNRTVTLCGVFGADVLAYRLTQNILQYVGWARFEAARDWCGACMMSFKCDVCSLDLGCAEPNSAQVSWKWCLRVGTVVRARPSFPYKWYILSKVIPF